MVERALKNMAVKLFDFPGNLLNIVFYILFLGGVSGGIHFIIIANNFSDLIINIVITFLFLGFVLNTLIQNFKFDKKFRHVIEENRDLYFDISCLPSRWTLKIAVIRGIIYAGSVLFSSSIFYKRFKRPSLVPIVNYLADLPEFQKSIKPINLLSAWILVIVGLVLFPLAGICVGILKYFF